MYVSFFVFLAFLIILEWFYKARNYPAIPWWKTRAICITVFTLSCAQLFSIWFDTVIPDVMLVNTSAYLPAPLAGLVGFMWATLAVYWWHLAMHKSDLLWRLFHQLHHSPQRIELLATFYTHPLNSISVTFFGSIMVHIIGLNIEAVGWYAIIYSMASVFNHVNISVPRWIGYFIQTPDMHRVHHEYQRHQNNYAEFPLWDMLFGTYRNPEKAPERCGFDTDKEIKVFSMLMLKDVHKRAKVPE
ncbi:sterol desaturase family protein [Gynuella sunshinyii]|uniref:Sterol desaturase n=1 Tax=Gynuella sunshinyii YC6258 TaxID=1445510 RepID=A0A0C5VTG4_9GAMM|nr:sterol desaturase family protein [Gynuella sunshinyii]AJQ97476.1 sterol desaturase [Gynuella sunshinyii YC6258]